MRIFNRAHVPWFIFVCVATLAAVVLYVANFYPARLPPVIHVPAAFIQKPSEHRSVGGTPLGLIYGAISLSIFVFAALLGVRKKVVLWRIGNVQRWLRAHIWLTLLTVPLVILHSGFRFGGPMTSLLVVLYIIVMVSGIYGLALQHQMPRIMKERLPAETVYEQIPHIRAQLYVAATKMRDSFKPVPSAKTDAGAPAPSAAKAVTSGSTPMASTSAELSTPTARAKTVVGSTITAATVGTPATGATQSSPSSSPVPAPKSTTPSPKPAAAPAPTVDPASEAALVEFLEQQILPYLASHRGDKFRLGQSRYSEDIFRFVKLRVAEVYRGRVEEIQAWCDERRMLDLQTKLQHWLHGWLFVHAPVSFLLIMLTAWHAYVTLFYY
jgi:hypothetical protein